MFDKALERGKLIVDGLLRSAAILHRRGLGDQPAVDHKGRDLAARIDGKKGVPRCSFCAMRIGFFS